jgi:hypothetical protein
MERVKAARMREEIDVDYFFRQFDTTVRFAVRDALPCCGEGGRIVEVVGG